MDLSKIFVNQFDTDRISDDKLGKFTTIHISLLAGANNNGEYTVMIKDTIKAYDPYYGAIIDEDTNTAVRQSLTRSMNNIFSTFQSGISQKEGIVRGIFGIKSPEYKEFFPQGLTEYSKANLANVGTLMNRMVNASTKYQDKLGEDFVLYFTELRDNFASARTAQLDKMGEVTDKKGKTSTVRDELEIQLMKNLLTLAKKYIGKPEEGMKFFDQSVL